MFPSATCNDEDGANLSEKLAARQHYQLISLRSGVDGRSLQDYYPEPADAPAFSAHPRAPTACRVTVSKIDADQLRPVLSCDSHKQHAYK